MQQKPIKKLKQGRQLQRSDLCTSIVFRWHRWRMIPTWFLACFRDSEVLPPLPPPHCGQRSDNERENIVIVITHFRLGFDLGRFLSGDKLASSPYELSKLLSFELEASYDASFITCAASDYRSRSPVTQFAFVRCQNRKNIEKKVLSGWTRRDKKALLRPHWLWLVGVN